VAEDVVAFAFGSSPLSVSACLTRNSKETPVRRAATWIASRISGAPYGAMGLVRIIPRS
jgi:hypothetical protein